jgi:hypothetical protein
MKKRQIRAFKGKIVCCGDIVELYSYEKTIYEGYNQEDHKGRAGKSDKVTTIEEKEKNRQDSMTRAKQRLRRVINANIDQYGVSSKFVTLTYSENMEDIKSGNDDFKKFVKRLNYKLGIKLKYSVVIEFQKRGAIHYHMIAYNLPYIRNKQLKDIWRHGWVRVNKIDHLTNVGAYVTKYMTKANEDPRLRERKSYFNSRGLKQPIETKLYDDKEKEGLRQDLQEKLTYSTEFHNDHLGTITYEQYNLKREEIEHGTEGN